MVVIRCEREMEDSAPPQELWSGGAYFVWWTIVPKRQKYSVTSTEKGLSNGTENQQYQ